MSVQEERGRRGIEGMDVDFVAALVSWHDDFIFFLPLSWIVREELSCTPGLLVVGIERQGCRGSGTSKDLRPGLRMLPLVVFLIQGGFVFFWRVFRQHLYIAPGCEGRVVLHPRVVGGRNRTTGLPRVGDVEGLATGLRLSFCILIQA